jgi:hypothetical protein
LFFTFLAATESLGMLEAFFIGRALAETVNERLGSVVGDVVAEVGKLEAELRRSIQCVCLFLIFLALLLVVFDSYLTTYYSPIDVFHNFTNIVFFI